MIIVKIWGGLGNQMFQYAFGRALALRNGTEFKMDIDFYRTVDPEKGHVFRTYDLDILNVKEVFATQKESSRLSRRFQNEFLEKVANKIVGHKKSYIREPHFHFSSIVYNAPDNRYFSGYWQTERYFKEIEPLIRSEFTFKEAMGAKQQELLEKIKNSNSVCVNVRRGDFLTNANLGFQGADYFQRAQPIVQERVKDPTYFVFSDEVDWCEANLRFDGPVNFVSHDFAGRKFQDYLRLMAGCKHYIIPNSSFAWWAVWFNQSNDKLVIAPKVWFRDTSLNTKDLLPADWIRV